MTPNNFQSSQGQVSRVSEKDNQGRWTKKECLKFVLFIDCFVAVFKDDYTRKKLKIFMYVQKFIQGRKSSQCRSHFQKLMKKHKIIDRVIADYKERIGEDIYQYKKTEIMKELHLKEFFRVLFEEQKSLEGKRKEMISVGTQIDLTNIGDLKNPEIKYAPQTVFQNWNEFYFQMWPNNFQSFNINYPSN